MLHHKSIKNLAIKDFGIIKEKIEKINIALNKIARETGENEYDPIFILEKQCNIKVEFQEVGELRGRNIWIWVIIPYKEEISVILEQKLIKYNLPLSDYLQILYVNKLKYIKYPEKIEVCRVQKEIDEILKEEHDITDYFLKSNEWEQIQNSDTWIKAQVEIAREFVADKLLNESKALIC
ncbi:MAG: hypothetical protein KAW51_10125 [Candidatus Lokiarchaeota archaeon]|nr:hypothetical protein [Candidatus Lokiarchaeota archaeon]